MKRHPFDPWSFIFGLFLSSVGLLLLVPATPFVRPDAISNFMGIGLPALVVVAGLALLAPIFRKKPETVPPPPFTDELPPSPLDSL